MNSIRFPCKGRRALVATACALLAACAQQPSAPPAAAPPAPAAAGAPATMPAPSADAGAVPIVDPGVLAEMDRMATALRGLTRFELRIASLTDEMLDSSQTAQIGLEAVLRVRRPDGMRVEMRDDRGDRKLLYYNGKTTSVYGPGTGYYATIVSPDTIRGLVDVLAERYGIDLPGADLFYWDSSSFAADQFKSAVYLGTAMVEGTSTHHFAFSQDGLDWEIWLQRGDAPLPRKLLLTTTSLSARPRHAVLMRWNLSPRIAAREFDFRPPAGARRIAIQRSDGDVEAP